MTVRKAVYAALAAFVVSASFAAAADAATTRHRGTAAAMHHSTKARAGAPRDSAKAATDALNQRSLDAARGGVSQ